MCFLELVDKGNLFAGGGGAGEFMWTGICKRESACVYVCVLIAKLINSSHLFQMLTIQPNLSCNGNHHSLPWRVNKTIMHNLITKPYLSPINMTSAHTEAYYANCLYSLVNRVIDLVGLVSQHRRSSLME